MFIWSSIAHLIALTSPGPDTAIIIRQVNLYGRKSGYIAALGIGVGIYLHCLLAINGISLLILSNPVYKLTITIIGGSYLIYLGFLMFKTSTNNNFDELSPTQEYKSIRQSFANGFITNIFNIKAFIFFISLFTILIDSIDGVFFYLYPIYFAITTSLWFMLLSYLLTVNKKINIHNNKLINRLMAFFLLIIGLYLIINTAYEYF